MALEAVVYHQDFLSTYNGSLLGAYEIDDDGKGFCFDDHHHFLENQTESFINADYWNCNEDNNNNNSTSPPLTVLPNLNSEDASADNSKSNGNGDSTNGSCSAPISQRPKRRRARSRKNQEEIENQRMTHIAVERNRRKQMNEYLSVLRSLMPDSFVQRGDQASIVGGAINFVKELEQKLHSLLGAQKEKYEPFLDFFAFPQYSTAAATASSSSSSPSSSSSSSTTHNSVADIEVNMVESHANLKIRSKRRRPRQLLKLVSGIQSMRLTVLHLNVTTADDHQTVIYSLSVKVEDECNLTSGDDIATAVYQLLGRIQEDA